MALKQRKRLFITGRVQGVGFRPAVYRLAQRLGLTGFVLNDTKGVTIEIQGPADAVSEFTRQFKTGSSLTPLAYIKKCSIEEIKPIESETDFVISPSRMSETALAEVSPDIATCKDCLREMWDEQDFRYRYPFINCTNCGPRYSILKKIPYDRPNTTMSVFQMCDRCAQQYKNPADRRFHAQPVACGSCGPEIWLTDSKGNILERTCDAVLATAAKILSEGKIIAIKGIGGFHLAVDALNNDAVLRLRKRKKRDAKPFAMMTDSIEKIEKYAVVTDIARQVISSPEAPIVLLPKKPNSNIAPSVAEGVSTFGFMLCYAPLHWLLFDEGLEVLVMTSGNISDEPIICENNEALEKLSGVADAFLMHNRDIYRRLDDSIVHFIDDQPVLLRRARGYVPTPITAKHHCDVDIFAAGSDMKNTFCYVKSNQFIISEHIGDMEDANVYRNYIKAVEHIAELFDVSPKVIACDLHPAYFSSRYAHTETENPLQIQHHWAHIASVLAEYEMDEKVIGLECDGTGYGTDSTIWGCECLIAGLSGFERFGHLAYYSLAGADLAAKEAIRPIIALLKQAYADKFKLADFSWLLKPIEPNVNKQRLILEQIQKNINTVHTSSLGRIFDAVAAMLGLGSTNNFDAQLPMALEAITVDGIESCYDFDVGSQNPILLDIRTTIRQIVDDIRSCKAKSEIATKFHNTIAAALCEMAQKARDATSISTVALSGGVFCNRYLTNRLIKLLKQTGFTVLFNRLVPSNDGGISLGQAAIAAKKLKEKKLNT